MAKYFTFLFLNLGATLIPNAVDTTGPAVYPLILLQTENGLRRPYKLIVEEGLWVDRIYEFTVYVLGRQSTEPATLLFCGPTPKNRLRIEEAQRNAKHIGIETDVVSEYCLFDWEDSLKQTIVDLFAVNRDFVKCDVEPEPLISRIFLDKNRNDTNEKGSEHVHETRLCGPGNNGKLYRHGYQIWLKEGLLDKVQNDLDSGLTKSKVYPHENIIDYEIFRICYDTEEKQVLYTQHKMISPRLLRKPYLNQEIKKKYTISEDNFDLEELDFQERAMKYRKYTKGEGKNNILSWYFIGAESSKTEQEPFLVTQLVPATDFAFALYGKPTWHHVNFDLIREELFNLWNDIIIAIQNHAIRYAYAIEFVIYTKTFNIRMKSDKNSTTSTEKPQIWIKVIHQGSRAVVIIANNELDEQLNVKISKNYCHIDYCETFDNFGTKYNPFVQKFIKCCAINEEIENLFNLNPSLNIKRPGEEGLLRIKGLITEEQQV